MRILFINTQNLHHKNLHAIRHYKNIEWVDTDNIEKIDNLNTFDCVFSPNVPINVSKYPSTFFIFGPHFSIFPDNNLRSIVGPNVVYNLLSSWVKEHWLKYSITQNINLVTIPFGVDTELFREVRPFRERTEVFIYYKTRKPSELAYIGQFLDRLGVSYDFFNYSQRYDEKSYRECLNNAKYGIWVGRHESQGFALEEALSCNVPLLVWDVKSMNQEYGYHYDDIPATCIPYWDERCGEVFYTESEFTEAYTRFIRKIQDYRPREYVLENLSIEVCERKLMEEIRKNFLL